MRFAIKIDCSNITRVQLLCYNVWYSLETIARFGFSQIKRTEYYFAFTRNRNLDGFRRDRVELEHEERYYSGASY